MGDLNELVACITGGASGLGRALVSRFIDEGAKVCVLDRDANRLEELKAEFGDQVEICKGSVESFSDNQRAVQVAVTSFGKLDCFIANAGIFDFFEPIAKIEGDKLGVAFDELMGVNVKGGVLGVRAALPELVKSNGSVIFTISNAGFYPGGGGVLYTASKHALVGAVKQLAHELAPKVRVNGVAPGGMNTNLSGLSAMGTDGQRLNQMEGLDSLLEEITPLRIAPTPEQCCGPYVLLASRKEAAPMTGVIISTDGGFGVRGIMQVRGGDDL